jgi:hypothetical protein
VLPSDSEAAARSSPGRGRPELGDDTGAPLVRDPGRGRRDTTGGLVAVVSWAAQPLGCIAREKWAAATTAAGPVAATGLARGDGLK